ncbi:hypothetical protein L596_005228 [Steinernema carpocapsae]|uniref:Uncharacterized protein n=1 Tax=Steinernema carpocapsae TaxID=34508 RepID=A0A4U8UYL0_STECR|nr:hypothetical protein L596_005228 [Steinernema carpocapsae]
MLLIFPLFEFHLLSKAHKHPPYPASGSDLLIAVILSSPFLALLNAEVFFNVLPTCSQGRVIKVKRLISLRSSPRTVANAIYVSRRPRAKQKVERISCWSFNSSSSSSPDAYRSPVIVSLFSTLRKHCYPPLSGQLVAIGRPLLYVCPSVPLPHKFLVVHF